VPALLSEETYLAQYDAMFRAIPDATTALRLLNSAQHEFWFPRMPGIYVFDDLKGIVYVGESHNLRRRLTKHERGYLRKAVGVRCRIVPCSNHKEVERWLIAALRPRLNGRSYVRGHLRQIARQLLRQRFEPDDQTLSVQHELWPDLQPRYPKASSPKTEEPEYVLLEHMTREDIDYNVARLRNEANAKLRHADALEAFGRSLPIGGMSASRPIGARAETKG
jgi:hypothetical protein